MKFSIRHWLHRFQKYFFYYRDGFYELPYVANSPELTVQSFNAMPFIKSHPKEERFSTSNPFLVSSGHYHKIEDGLWIIMSEVDVKRDMSFKLYYEPDIPAPYHFLTLYLNRGKKEVKSPKIHMDIDNLDRSWTLFKAGSKALNTHFKGQKSIFFTIYFSDEWMQNNISSDGVLKNATLQNFFDSKEECLFLPYFLDDKKDVYENLVNSILDKDENGIRDTLMVKINTLNLIASFVEKLDDSSVNKSVNSMADRDKRMIIKAEHMLNEAIFRAFPTISAIAKEVGVSETKLKADFKSIYGMTLYQYYAHVQMKYARELLMSNEIPVKEVAYSMGYTNPGKFSAAFKKVHGKLPSEIK